MMLRRCLLLGTTLSLLSSVACSGRDDDSYRVPEEAIEETLLTTQTLTPTVSLGAAGANAERASLAAEKRSE